jgi:hypothetical protein
MNIAESPYRAVHSRFNKQHLSAEGPYKHPKYASGGYQTVAHVANHPALYAARTTSSGTVFEHSMQPNITNGSSPLAPIRALVSAEVVAQLDPTTLDKLNENITVESAFLRQEQPVKKSRFSRKEAAPQYDYIPATLANTGLASGNGPLTLITYQAGQLQRAGARIRNLQTDGGAFYNSEYNRGGNSLAVRWAVEAQEAQDFVAALRSDPQLVREQAATTVSEFLQVDLRESTQQPPYADWERTLGGCLMGMSVTLTGQSPSHEVISV